MARRNLHVWSADGFIPPASNAPEYDEGDTSLRNWLGFDASTVETTYSKPTALPTYTGTLKVDVHYFMASATSGSVDWEVSVEAVSAGDALDMTGSPSFDTANANHGTVPGTAGYLGVITITLTNLDSAAVGDTIRLKVERDADDGTNDTATGDALLYMIVLYAE